MCKAFDDLMEDSRNEGIDMMGKLTLKLISAGRIDDLKLASTDKQYRKKLMVEFGIA